MGSPAAGTARRFPGLATAFPAVAVLVVLAQGCSGDSDPLEPGPGGGGPFTYASTDVPKSIPDGAGGGPATSYLTVAGAPTSIPRSP